MANDLALPDPQKYNVLVPVSNVVGRLTPFHVLRFTEVTLDVRDAKDGGETYHPTGTPAGARAPLKAPLTRLGNAAGVRQVSSRPLSDPKDREYLLWQVELEMPVTGQEPIRAIATKEWRDGVDNVKQDGTEDKGATKNRLRVTESKAFLAAMRQLLGLKGTYTAAELEKGFQVPHIDYVPDLTDENVRAVVAVRQMQALSALYGAPEPECDGDGTDESPLVGELVVEWASGADIPADLSAASALSPEEQARYDMLKDFQVQSDKSPYDGWTFFDILSRDAAWFTNLIEWAATPNLEMSDTVKETVKAAREFIDLVEKQGGELK